MKRTIALALEDRAHETVIRALLARIFSDEGQNLHDWALVVLSNRGGVSLECAYDYAKKCRDPGQACDLLVIASDANCSEFVEKRNEIQKHLEQYAGRIALALPNPHIERWLLLDPEAFQQGVGIPRGIVLPQYKCDKNYYKTELNSLLQSEGIVPQFPGGIEFAPGIIKHLDMPLAC
ncbi:MAG: hypothetical protein IH897_10505, partial [Planctomycetes bacterium]|nr:hypothetical protein [Planctomycetota bacterium]